MNPIHYIKEKWYMFVTFILSVLFTSAIYILDEDSLTGNPNTVYIFSAIFLFFVFYIVIDYITFIERAKKLSSFIINGGIKDFESYYPSDIKRAKEIHAIADEYNKYRVKIASQSADELDFITKWVHDVKVPISAMKLLLEDDSKDMKDRLEMEISSIDQNTQKVLFHIKSKSFYDDYKIAEISTKIIVNSSLKQFATFFSYKKIKLTIEGEDQKVLTDSKWSGYIISQFISNAIKHTDVSGEISIKTTKVKNGITISIKNTGIGIEKRDLQSVFDRGYTASGNRNQSATGYGLYLSKKLSDKLGHKVSVESEYGKYAKFNLVF